MLSRKTIELIYVELHHLYEEAINLHGSSGGSQNLEDDMCQYGTALAELEEEYPHLIGLKIIKLPLDIESIILL